MPAVDRKPAWASEADSECIQSSVLMIWLITKESTNPEGTIYNSYSIKVNDDVTIGGGFYCEIWPSASVIDVDRCLFPLGIG